MNWKLLRPLVPYLSVAIILLGLFHQIIYYYQFGLSIKYFIGVSELLLVIANQLILLIISMSIFAALVLIFFSDMVRNFSHRAPTIKTLRQRLSSPDYIFTSILLFVTVMVFIFGKNSTVKGLLAFILLTNLYSVLWYEFRIAYEKIFKTTFQNTYYHLISSFLFTVIMLIIITNIEVNNTQKGRFIGTMVYTKDSTYVSDSFHYFIGKTEKYVFIYNKPEKSTIVIPEKEIEQLIIKDKFPL